MNGKVSGSLDTRLLGTLRSHHFLQKRFIPIYKTVQLVGRGVFDKTYRTAFQRPRNHVVLHRFRKGQVGNLGKTPGSAARAKKKLVRRAFPPFTVCFGFASSGSGWCPVPALPSSRKPSGCQRSPLRRTPAAKQIPSARLLPIYSTEAAFQGAPGDSNQIKSPLPCRHPICILPAQKKPCRSLIQKSME